MTTTTMTMPILLNMMKEAKDAFSEYINWLNTDRNRKLINKAQRVIIRGLIEYWNGKDNKTWQNLLDLKYTHRHINGALQNNSAWDNYISKSMTLRLNMMLYCGLRHGYH